MFIGETEVRYWLDFIYQDNWDVDWSGMGLKLKSTIKKWIQTYDLQDEYPKLWEEVSTES